MAPFVKRFRGGKMSNKLGSIIRATRKEMNMTQCKLSENICTQATISMIEKNEILPGLEILYAISIKLKKPLSFFLNVMQDEKYFHTNTIVNEIEKLTTSHQYNKVYKIVVRELTYKTNNQWYLAFLTWQKIWCKYQLKYIHVDQAIYELKNLLKNNEENILMKNFLDDRIYNTIAILYAIAKKYDNAFLYFKKIKIPQNFHDSPRLSQNIYLIRVKYNIAKTYFDKKDFREAKVCIEEGIKLSLQMENMSFIGNFYYYDGLIKENLNYSFEEISDSYKRAEFFFKILNRDKYLIILKKEKCNYL